MELMVEEVTASSLVHMLLFLLWPTSDDEPLGGASFETGFCPHGGKV